MALPLLEHEARGPPPASQLPTVATGACRAETDAPSPCSPSLRRPLRLDLDPPVGETAGIVGEKA